jgi:uncharacterized protein (UPF0332 family)
MEINEVAGHMKKAMNNLQSAQLLFDNELYDEAVNASYYAVFHGVSAILADKGFSFNKHKTLINKYNEVFIYPGLISSQSFRALTALFNQRMVSEYRATVFTKQEGANEALKLAKSAVQEIIDYCSAIEIEWGIKDSDEAGLNV